MKKKPVKKEFKVGDQAIVDYDRTRYVREIVKVTATIITLDDGNEYTKRTRCQRPRQTGRWARNRYIRFPEPGELEKLAEQRDRQHATDFIKYGCEFSKQPTHVIVKAAKLLGWKE